MDGGRTVTTDETPVRKLLEHSHYNNRGEIGPHGPVPRPAIEWNLQTPSEVLPGSLGVVEGRRGRYIVLSRHAGHLIPSTLLYSEDSKRMFSDTESQTDEREPR